LFFDTIKTVQHSKKIGGIQIERILTYIAQTGDEGETIKSILKRHFHMSTNLITSLKRDRDGITVNGAHRRVTYRLAEGDCLRITMYDSVSEHIVSAKMPLSIVYEDEDLLILNKPPHLPTHPSMGNYDNTLANGVMYHWRSVGEERVFRPVNRLDKDTSGLMAVAKNAYTHARLCDQIKDGTLKRRYCAIVCGQLETGAVVDAPIRREADSVIRRCVAPDGQRAVTHYNVVEALSGYTLLNLTLETGRTHQIRVHMAHIGHPLLGDWLYGTEDHTRFQRQALHSCYLELVHPISHRRMVWQAELPEDMRDFVLKYRRNS
jgi:23S rRNA pseudouridine1911/1915/1917 synthase